MSTSAANKKPLRYWLAQEDWYMSRFTREWLERTPREEAANTLARIAADAQPEPHSYLNQIFSGLTAAFTTSEAIGGGGVVARRVGTRAALMLADLGDARCIPALARVFETSLSWRAKYQELVETALTRFLSQAEGQTELLEYDNDIQRLVERVWNMGRPTQELSEAHTDLLLAALRCLQEISGPLNLAVIRSIAAALVTAPTRLRVKEAAQNLLHS